LYVCESRAPDSAGEFNDVNTTYTGEVSTMSTGLLLSELQYTNVLIEGVTEPVTALEDNVAEVAMVNTGLVRHLHLPVLDKIIIRPVVGQMVEADLVPLKIKPYAAQPYTNIAPYVEVIFAACELATDVNLILCGSVVKQLNELRAYDILKCPVTRSEVVIDAVTTRSMSPQGQVFDDQSTVQHVDDKLSDDDEDDETFNVASDDTVSDVVFNTHDDGSVTVNNSARHVMH